MTKGLLQKYGAERIRDTPITEVSPPMCWRPVSLDGHKPLWETTHRKLLVSVT